MLFASPVLRLAALGFCAAVLNLAGCAASAPLPAAAPTPAPGQWVTLFDGTNTDAWRGYCQPGMPKKGWAIEGDALHIKPDAGCGDLITKAQFGDFVLELEYKTAPSVNSGVFYRAVEKRGDEIWQSAFECQILDPAWREDHKGPNFGKPMDMLHHAGALYAMYPTQEAALKPAGQWNQLRICVTRGGHIEHWLNGLRVVSCDMGSPDFNARLAKSKFGKDSQTFPNFGKAHFGHLGLQDHGDSDVWFRNIRVMALDQPEPTILEKLGM